HEAAAKADAAFNLTIVNVRLVAYRRCEGNDNRRLNSRGRGKKVGRAHAVRRVRANLDRLSRRCEPTRYLLELDSVTPRRQIVQNIAPIEPIGSRIALSAPLTAQSVVGGVGNVARANRDGEAAGLRAKRGVAKIEHRELIISPCTNGNRLGWRLKKTSHRP